MNINGRGKGNTNKLTKASKTTLYLALKNQFENLDKTIRAAPYEERASLLLKYLPFIAPKGKAYCSEGEEIQELICAQLKPHYAKIGILINQSPAKDKALILARILQYLTPTQQAQATSAIPTTIKNKGIDK